MKKLSIVLAAMLVLALLCSCAKPAPEAPAAAPSFSAPAAPDGAPGAGDVAPASVLDDVPDELRGILENAFEVFGAGVKARTEPAQPAAKGYDSDAASEGADAGGEG